MVNKTRGIRRTLFLVIILFLVTVNFSYCQQEGENKKVNFRLAETWLLGDFTYDLFLNHPHDLWFNDGFDKYIFDDKTFVELSELSLEGLSLVMVIGTWCPDSRREVPRFLKITESLGLSQDRIRYIGVDSNKEAPLDDYADLDIERVPTFIFYRDKVEIGRIIEYPKTSLERDMLDILKGKAERN